MSLPHHKLVVWQRADDFFVDVHRLTHQQFPKEERFELSSQVRRAAYSVAANIVEASARQHPREGLHFASASLAELGYGLHAAKRLGYLDERTYLDLERRIRAVAAPLNGLMNRYRSGRILDGVVPVGSE